MEFTCAVRYLWRFIYILCNDVQRTPLKDTAHSTRTTQHTAHSTQHTAHSTQHTAHSTHERKEQMNATTKTIKLSRPKNKKNIKTIKKTKLHNTYVVEFSDFYLVFVGLLNPSNNSKTGEMIQTYFLDKADLIKEPRVFGSKCKACPLVDVCYVSRDKLSVRKALVRLINGEKTSYVWSSFEDMLPRLKGRALRWGTYGDPSILPLDLLKKACSVLSTWTGYTHFWREIDAGYSEFLMASCEDLSGELLAQSIGYRTFRVLLKKDDNLEVSARSIECPNVTRGLQCIDCGLCKGTTKKAKSIYIYQH